MDIIVKAKNCDISGRLKTDAVARVQHATRFFDRLLTVEMVFAKEQNPRIAESALVELTARTKGHHIRAEGAAGDHRDAVDVAVTRFERQLARYKARLIDRSRRPSRAGVGSAAAARSNGLVPTGSLDEPDNSWPQPKIVKTKEFEAAPMLPEEAAVQLELLGHEWFVFANAATGRCNVVYRRRDGDLGLIDLVTDASPSD